jgi:hypothetical protein
VLPLALAKWCGGCRQAVGQNKADEGVRPELLHHLETAKAALYLFGGADSARFVDNFQYLVMNRSPL